ncbi:hypothetical protein ACFE04_014361 [Oxalis oulophora]
MRDDDDIPFIDIDVDDDDDTNAVIGTDDGDDVLPDVVNNNNRQIENVTRDDDISIIDEETFRQMVGAFNEGGPWDDFMPMLPPSGRRAQHLRSSQGESSSAAVAANAEDEMMDLDEYFDRDSHHKRAKVYSAPTESYAATPASNVGTSRPPLGIDYDFSQGSSDPSKDKIVYHNFLLNDVHGVNSSGGNDNQDPSGNSENEDLEVQMDLTDDLLHMVFSFLEHNDLCRAAMVCRQWQVASSHEDFWRCLNFENRNISIDQFQDMCRRYPNATELNIFGAPATIHYLLTDAILSLRNLDSLIMGRGIVADAFFHALGDCPMLTSLNISDATLGNTIQEIPINHDRLRRLKLTKCRVMRISIRCPQLQSLSLKRSNMAQALLNCPLLRVLDIGSCHKLTDAAVRSAVIACPQLESLDMSNCTSASDETLREIAQACTNLHILNASYCPNISLESVRLPMLTVLKLHSCEGITTASMTALAFSTMLEVLELDNCSLLTSVSLDLPRLQNIRLVHCRKFVELILRTMVLSSIMVSNCPALQRVNITSNALQKLVLQKQENLTSLTLQCQSLQEVDLTDCESLKNSICEVFSDGGGCPMLKSLILDNCESLTDMRICSTSLVCLSLLGCRAITALELACPSLEQVCLDGCDHLERASFSPVSLQSLNLGICPKLNTLSIQAPCMVLLELKGCGVLAEATINCPLLTSLDASFCSQLKDDCLSATTASCPLIETLILMSCPSICSDGLYSLRSLPNLTTLDLSYTFLMNLQPVFESCLQLKKKTSTKKTSTNTKRERDGGCGFSVVVSPSSSVSITVRGLSADVGDGDCGGLVILKKQRENQMGESQKWEGDQKDSVSVTKRDSVSVTKRDPVSMTKRRRSWWRRRRVFGDLVLREEEQRLWCWDWRSGDCVWGMERGEGVRDKEKERDRVLKLQACKYLTNASLEPLYKKGALPALQELDLSYGTLCQSAIEELLACCTHLTHVSLNGCANMHDLNWGYGSELPSSSAKLSFEPNRLLEHLNCVGCPNIRKVLIPPAARCINLTSLNLSLSGNLKEVDVSCLNLCCLNLSNCCSLEVLKLECPKLTSLFLQSCNIDEEAVGAAISNCTMLETLDVRFCPKICSKSLNMGKLRAACPSLKRIYNSLLAA